jgi:hypothetical protein
VLSQIGIGPDEHLRPIVVELDGNAFHHKHKKQRAYEKARDRFWSSRDTAFCISQAVRLSPIRTRWPLKL